MKKDPVYTWKINTPQVERLLNTKREALAVATAHHAKFEKLTEEAFAKLVQDHFPLEQELLRLVDCDAEDPGNNAKYLWEVIQFAGNPEILEFGMANQEQLDLNSRARTLKFKVHLPITPGLAERTIQHVRDYFEEFNEVITNYHKTAIDRLRGDVIVDDGSAAASKCGAGGIEKDQAFLKSAIGAGHTVRRATRWWRQPHPWIRVMWACISPLTVM